MSDHYSRVVQRAAASLQSSSLSSSMGIRKDQDEQQQQQQHHHHHHHDNVAAVDQIRTSCDRRLSRAAREIVKQKLLAAMIAETATTTTTGDSKNHDNRTVWELLESVVTSSDNNNADTSSLSRSSCPLMRQRDVLQYHEQQVSIIPANMQGRRFDTPTASRRLVNNQNNKLQAHWFQCLACGKTFSSRYYLDLHLERQHPHPPPTSSQSTATASLSTEEIVDWICPATDWCGTFLSWSACHEMALELEPHYGPGIASATGIGGHTGIGGGRRRQERLAMERQLWRQAHEQPCTTSDMDRAKVSCRSMIQMCFLANNNEDNNDKGGGDPDPASTSSRTRRRIAQVLDKSLCGATLSCPDRLHRLYFQTKTGGDLVMRHVHEWQEEWSYWSEEHHEVGWIGLFVLLSLAVWYASALLDHLPPLPRTRIHALVPSYFHNEKRKRKRLTKAQGTRLLRKSPIKTKERKAKEQ